MKFHLIVDHPNTGSFTHSILQVFIEGLKRNNHSFDILDLCQENFDPTMSVEELKNYESGQSNNPKILDYQNRIINCNNLAIFFPIWWMVMPARLKGWMDKVLLPGFAFTRGAFPQPLLTHIQSASIFTTTAVPDEVHRREFNNALEWVLCKGTLKFVGVQTTKWLNFGETGIADQAAHAAWLEKVRDYASQL
jgi:NAD(P)H dehydrogenase (quinone)